MIIDEGLAKRNGENLNIQCLLMERKSSISKNEISYHYHEYVELIYVLEGKMRGLISNDVFKLNKEDIFVIYPGEPHNFIADEKCEYIVVKFLPDIIFSRESSANEFEYIFNLNGNNKNQTRIISGITVANQLIIDALEAFEQNDYTSELRVRSDMLRVCAEILEYWKKNDEIISIKSNINRDSIRQIRNVMEYVKESNGFIKTNEAAKICGMSDGHFSRIFKSATGMTFGEYVKLYKMTYAERVLQCTDVSVTSIAQELNYATTSHFIEDFKKRKGISPKQYRKIIKERVQR